MSADSAAILGLAFGVGAFVNAQRLRRRLNTIERMLAWKGVLKLDETAERNLPAEVKADLREWNRWW